MLDKALLGRCESDWNAVDVSSLPWNLVATTGFESAIFDVRTTILRGIH